jgi:hypothetical protein
VWYLLLSFCLCQNYFYITWWKFIIASLKRTRNLEIRSPSSLETVRVLFWYSSHRNVFWINCLQHAKIYNFFYRFQPVKFLYAGPSKDLRDLFAYTYWMYWHLIRGIYVYEIPIDMFTSCKLYMSFIWNKVFCVPGCLKKIASIKCSFYFAYFSDWGGLGLHFAIIAHLSPFYKAYDSISIPPPPRRQITFHQLDGFSENRISNMAADYNCEAVMTSVYKLRTHKFYVICCVC